MIISNILHMLIDNNGTLAMQASQNKMDFVNSWLLMSSPVSPALILATYLMFVLKIGPSYMKDRKPFQLQHVLAFYNAIQVILSSFLIYACGRMLLIYGLVPKTCVLDTEFSRQGIAAGMHYYLLAKVSELLDTVFFVLRKKTRQISFLHVYHHSLMVIVTWTALKYEPTIHLLFLGVVNSFIHVIMYMYYGLSSFPSLAKYLWWKKYITSLQLVQFVIVMTQFVAAAKVSDCTPSIILSIALLMNGFLFLYLFGTFYLKNYTKKNLSRDTKLNIANGHSLNALNGHIKNSHKENKVVYNECISKECIGTNANKFATNDVKHNFSNCKSIKQL